MLYENNTPYQRLADGKGESTNYGKTDEFFIFLYQYYEYKGYWNMILVRVLNVMQLAFMTGLYIFLTAYIDYSSNEAKDFRDMVSSQKIGFWGGIGLFLLIVYLLILSVKSYLEIKETGHMYHFYNDILKVEDSELYSTPWGDIAKKVIQVPSIKGSSENFSELDLANLIMRRENYVIAMMNKGILETDLPLAGGQLVGTKALEWITFLVIFTFFFNAKGHPVVSHVTHSQLVSTKRRFKEWINKLALASLFLSPLVLLYLAMYAILRYAQELKTSPGTLSSRRWSNASLWKFREFNELYHIFKERMNKSYIPTMEYIKNFENHIISNLARFGAFVFGSCATILILLSIFEIEEFWGRNVLWWLSILAGLLALCRAFIPDPTAVYNPKGYMRSIMHYTHYMPKKWRENEHKREVRTEVLYLFENKALIFLREVVSILLIPYVIYKVIGNKAEEICVFFSTFTVEKDGVGMVCKFATFDLKGCGNVKYGATNNADKELRSKQGKLEKSLLNFKTHHEGWKLDEEGSKMVRNLSEMSNLVDIDLDDDKIFDRMTTSTIFGENNDRLSSVISAQQRYYDSRK